MIFLSHQIKYLNGIFSFINFIVEKFNIKTLAEYGKLTYKIIPKWNSYAEMISQFREVEPADIQVFFDDYLPYKKEHPKDVNSRKLAEIACINYQEDTDKFYQEVLMKRNAYTGHGGELSPFSKEFKSYSHLSDDEKNKARRQKCFCKDREDFDKLNNQLCEAGTKANILANILMPMMANIGHINYAITAILGVLMIISKKLIIMKYLKLIQ